MKIGEAQQIINAATQGSALTGAASENSFFDKEINDFQIDSRHVAPGDLFCALSAIDCKRHSFNGTEFTDGHEFIPAAMQAGAIGAIARREAFEADARLHEYADRLLLVEDVIEALQRLAKYVLNGWQRPVVGITGSAGKTTTRDLTAHVLAGAGRRVLKSRKNYNNELGAPLSILQMIANGRTPDDFDLAVLEIGMSMPGEIKRICEFARPSVGVVLLVSPVHLEFFGSVERIAESKRALIEALEEDGAAVLNADDERVAAMRSHTRAGRILTFGIEHDADVTARDIKATSLDRTEFLLQTPRGTAHAQLPVPGRHNLMNALAAASVATVFDIEPEQIAEALRTATASEMRGQILRFSEGFTVIDDSYNSNPRSLMQMARTLTESSRNDGRRIIIAGEMLELGKDAARIHLDTGREIGRLDVDELWGVRGLAQELIDGAKDAGLSRTRYFNSSDEAAEALEREVQAGDTVLVKGSRGVQTDRIVKRLRTKFTTDT